MHRIGIDIRLRYYRKGGIAEYMRGLIEGLAEQATPYDFAVLHNFRSHETLAPDEGFERKNLITPAHHRYESWLLAGELLRHRLDLLHTPDFIPPRFGAKRHVITVHDLAFLRFADIQTKASLRYYAGGIRRAVAQADAIIAVSNATRDDLIDLLSVPADKVHVVYEGLPPQFRPIDNASQREILAQYDLSPDEDFLLFVGTLEPRKNIIKMLDAYQIARGKSTDLPSFVLVGQKGWLADAIVERVQSQDGVIWLGSVAFEHLPAFYSAARLHILVSLYEGFGFPPLEAMACGTPTLVSDRGSLREIAGAAASFVDPDDIEAIADALTTLTQNATLLAEKSEAGLDYVRRFTWAQAARETLAVYKSILERS